MGHRKQYIVDQFEFGKLYKNTQFTHNNSIFYKNNNAISRQNRNITSLNEIQDSSRNQSRSCV